MEIIINILKFLALSGGIFIGGIILFYVIGLVFSIINFYIKHPEHREEINRGLIVLLGMIAILAALDILDPNFGGNY